MADNSSSRYSLEVKIEEIPHSYKFKLYDIYYRKWLWNNKNTQKYKLIIHYAKISYICDAETKLYGS